MQRRQHHRGARPEREAVATEIVGQEFSSRPGPNRLISVIIAPFPINLHRTVDHAFALCGETSPAFPDQQRGLPGV